MITAEQKTHWDVFGFLTLPQLFSPQEVDELRDAAMEVISKEGGVLNSDEGWSIGGFMEQHPVLMSYLDDDRIYEIPETMLGPDFVLEMTDGHVRGGNTHWHGRVPSEEPGEWHPNLRVAIYFDKLTRENGCLRVIPGSHQGSFAEHLSPLLSQREDPTAAPFGDVGPDVPCVALESEPGDVVIFTESVYHASFGGSARLQLTAQYISNPTTDEEIAKIRKQHDAYTFGFHPAESSINSDRPRVRRMVSRLVELGFTPLPV